MKRIRIGVLGSVLCFFLLSLTIALLTVRVRIPVSDTMEYIVAFMHLHGAVWMWGLALWMPMILGAFCLILASSARRSITGGKGIKSWGIFYVGSNLPAIIADITFVLSLVGTIVVSCTAQHFGLVGSWGLLGSVFLGIALFTFALHGICNGKNYQYIVGKKHKHKKTEGGGKK